jgi:hypothetical protein
MIPTLSGARGRDYAIVNDPIQIDNDLFYLADEYLLATEGEKVAPL